MGDPDPTRCRGQTKAGTRCKNPAGEDGYCHIPSHGPSAPEEHRDPSDPYWRINDRQRRFVDEYCIDGNGAGAARRAGYQGDPGTLASTASRLMTNDDIREAIDQRVERQAMSKKMATARIGAWARGSLEPFLKVVEVPVEYDEDEEPPDEPETRTLFRVDLTSPEAQANYHLIKKLKFDQYGQPVIEIQDPMKAVELILKMYGEFVDKVEHSGPDGGPIPLDDGEDFDPSTLTDEQLAKLDQKLAEAEQILEQPDDE